MNTLIQLNTRLWERVETIKTAQPFCRVTAAFSEFESFRKGIYDSVFWLSQTKTILTWSCTNYAILRHFPDGKYPLSVSLVTVLGGLVVVMYLVDLFCLSRRIFNKCLSEGKSVWYTIPYALLIGFPFDLGMISFVIVLSKIFEIDPFSMNHYHEGSLSYVMVLLVYALTFCYLVKLVSSFCRKYHVDLLSMSFGKNKSKYKLRGQIKFQVENFDLDYNNRLREKDCNGKGCPLRRLKGKTLVNFRGTNVVLDYPVFFEHDFKIMLESFSHVNELRAIASKKDVDSAVLIRLCSNPLRPMMFVYDEEYWRHGHVAMWYCFIMVVLYAYKHKPFTNFYLDISGVILAMFSLAILAACNGDAGHSIVRGHWWTILLSACAEEMHKYVFPYALPVAEYVNRLELAYNVGSFRVVVASTLPFIMHIYVSFLSPFHAVCFHFLYNLYIFNSTLSLDVSGTFGIDSLGMKDVKMVNRWILILNSFVEQRFVDLAQLLFAFGYYDSFLNFFSEVSSSMEDLIAMFVVSTGVRMTAGSKVLGIFSRLLPLKIQQSPAYVAIISLASCVFAHSLFTSFHEFVEFLPLVDFTNLSLGDMVVTGMESVGLIGKAVYCAYREGSLYNFFFDPKLYVLRVKSNELLTMDLSDEEKYVVFSTTVKEVCDKMVRSGDAFLISQVPKILARHSERGVSNMKHSSLIEACDLIAQNPVGVDQYDTLIANCQEKARDIHLSGNAFIVAKLKEKVADLNKKLKASSKRVRPTVMILLGPPGTGKTSLFDQIIASHFNAKGVVIDHTLVGHLAMEDKYPAEGLNPECKVLIANDIVADHSQDDKSDRVSFGVILQQIMDETPLKFKSAAIAGKGATFNNVELFIFTSNSRSFATCEDATRLKRRFDEYAVVVDIDVVELEHGVQRSVPFDRYQLWPSEKRNAATVFSHLGVTVEGSKFIFNRILSQRPVTALEFFKYLDMRRKLEPIRTAQTVSFFKDQCPCGLIYMNHYNGEDFEVVNNLCVSRERDCVPQISPPCNCGLISGHEKTPFVKCTRSEYHDVGVNNQRTNNAVSFTSLESVIWYPFMIFILYNARAYFSKVFEDIFELWSETLIRVDEVLLETRRATAWADSYLSLPMQCKLKASAAVLRFRTFIRRHFRILLLGPTAIGAYALYRRSLKVDATGKVIMVDNTDPDSLEIKSHRFDVNYEPEMAKAWNKPVVPLRVVELVKSGVGLSDLRSIVKANTVPITVSWAKSSLDGFALVIDSSWCLINRHYFYKDGKFCDNVIKFDGIFYNVGESDVVQVFSKGLPTENCLMRNPKPGPWKPIINFFSDDVSVSQTEIFVVGLDGDERAVATIGENDALKAGGYSPNLILWEAIKPAPDGHCGKGVVVASTKGSYILGNVCYRRNGVIHDSQGGMVVLRHDLADAMAKHPEPNVVSLTGSYGFDSSSLQRMHDNAEFRNFDTPFFEIIGSKNVPVQKFHSDFKKTDLLDFIEENQLFSKPYGVIKRIRGMKEIDGIPTYVSSFGQTIKGILPQGVIRSDSLRKNADAYVKYGVKSVFEAIGPIRLSPLSLGESFFGSKQLDVPRCNFDSSVGPEDRFYRSRKGIFELGEDEIFRADPNFTSKVEAFIQKLVDGSSVMPWVCGANKDEIRSIEKLENFQVRLFYTVDIYTNTVSRMYLMPLISLMMRFPKIFKCFGKTNSGSVEWDDLFRYVSSGDFKLDLDFKNYDISHGSRVIREVAWIFYKLGCVWYSNEEAARVCYLLVFGLTCQLFEHNNNFVLKYKGLPSGHILTLILNSIVNVILMMVSFEELYPDKDFFTEIFPATVGDDNVCGVSKACASFNLVTLVPIYKRMGYTITSASKKDIVEPFVSDEDLQFLKRRFRFELAVGSYVAPLEKDSIYKMLGFYTFKKDPACSYIDRMVAVLDVAQREMFLHGKNDFDAFVILFKPKVDELGWKVYWYTFDELVTKYLSAEEVFMSW